MMSVKELHDHYRSVKSRLNDPSKRFKSEDPPAAKMIIPDAETIVRMFEPNFSSPSTEIIYRIAQKHGVSVAEMRGVCRKPKFVRARQEAMYEIRVQRNLSLPQIATLMGNRHHTTVLHGIKKHADLLEKKARGGQ